MSAQVFDFLGAQPRERTRLQVLDTVRSGSGWLIAVAASIALVGVFVAYQMFAMHDRDGRIATLTADHAELQAQLQKVAAERQGVGPDLAPIAQPIEHMRDSGKTLADKISQVALLRPPRLWLDEVSGDTITGGAIDDSSVAQYVRSLHSRLGMPVSQGIRSAKALRRTFISFSLRVGR